MRRCCAERYRKKRFFIRVEILLDFCDPRLPRQAALAVATFITLLNPGSIEELNHRLKWFSRINGAWVDWLISLENRGKLSKFHGELLELAK